MTSYAFRGDDDATVVDADDRGDIRYVPVISAEGLPGYRVEWPDDRVTYLYLNPSVRDNDPTSAPNVYNDGAACYIDLTPPAPESRPNPGEYSASSWD